MSAQLASTASTPVNTLASLERQLRWLLPPDLYAVAWIDPSPKHLMQVFEHLRTLQHILVNYVPRDVSNNPPQPGYPQYSRQQGALLFTDLAGFTPLLEARAAEGMEGAELLLQLLNQYFAAMIEIIGKSSGNLLEFTGDALLVQFSTADRKRDIALAINAGLRMQRTMEEKFQRIATYQGDLSLKMRVGIHAGQFVTADIGNPQRMAHVLLGHAVTVAKQAEGCGRTGYVSLTSFVKQQLGDRVRLTPTHNHHWLVEDTLTSEELGEYEITVARRRSSPMLLDRSLPSLLQEIDSAIKMIEPLANYMPRSILQLIVETAADRQIPPAFPSIAVAFVNLIGPPESVDDALPEETQTVVSCFSDAFSLINGIVELKGGILQKVTYHSIGSEMLVHFGVLNPDPSDSRRAAEAMSQILQVVTDLPTPIVQGRAIELTCRIGLTYGPVFAAEIGEKRGRREFNVLGDTVNTAARIMSRAGKNEIWMNQAMHEQVHPYFQTHPLGHLQLKGKAAAQPVYLLQDKRE